MILIIGHYQPVKQIVSRYTMRTELSQTIIYIYQVYVHRRSSYTDIIALSMIGGDR